MSGFPYRLSTDDRNIRRIGVIVLQVDETIEQDLRRLIPTDAARLHVTRIASGGELTPETILKMSDELTLAAALLPDTKFDAIAYACTSGTAAIGAATVAERVLAGRRTMHVTDPLTAAIEAAALLGVRSLAIVSPYIAAVAQPVREAFTQRGIDVPVSISFGEVNESRVARIDQQSVKEAALHAIEVADPDCVFLSCTNLRTLDIIDALEQETRRPVLSSNQVLGWHIAALAGVRNASDAPGRLFARE